MKVLPLYPRLFFTLTLLSILLILLDTLNFLNIPKSLAQQITIPVEYGLYRSYLNIAKKFGFIFSAKQAFLENEALKKQLSTLLVENANLKKNLLETESLVDQYNKLNPRTFDLLPARVLGSSRYLLIDKGKDDGVNVGQVVVFQDNYIGEVKRVSQKMAWVLVVQDPDSKIAVYSQGKEGKARGILEGQFGSEALMNKILHQEVIELEDLVYSEGTEGKLPRGLILGRVSEVLTRQNEVFKQAKIEPIVRLNDLDVVFVLRSS